MKANSIVFSIVSGFLFLAGCIYWLMSQDPTGTTVIFFAFGLMFLIGYYLQFTSRRLPPQPQDQADADISDGAGELGFFSPFSWWPIVVALGAATLCLGLIFGMFLAVSGLLLLFGAVLGLMFEYYLGHQPHRADRASN